MRILQYNSQLQLRGQSTRYKVSSQFCLLLASTDCQEISPKYCKVETLSSYDHRPQGTEKRGLFTNPQLNRLDCYNSHMMSIQLPVPRVTRPHLSRYSIEPNPPTYTAVVSQKDVQTIVIRCSRFGVTYIYWSSASWVQLSMCMDEKNTSINCRFVISMVQIWIPPAKSVDALCSLHKMI